MAASSDICPLSVLELTALAGTNRHFHQMQWPRSSILWPVDDTLHLTDRGQNISATLVRLGERLRSPAVARAAKVLGRADCFCAWAEEDRCRAAWAIAAVLSSVAWSDLDSPIYLARFLALGLVAPAPWASLSTASAVLQMVWRLGQEARLLCRLTARGSCCFQFRCSCDLFCCLFSRACSCSTGWRSQESPVLFACSRPNPCRVWVKL